MIARISGKIIEQGNNFLLIAIGGITYQVFLPVTVIQRLEEAVGSDGNINLVTYHYYQADPSRSFPVLIGFINEIEREFFESFITVSGIGPKAALKALNKPISQIAKAIDEADSVFLTSLPGIGQQRAKEIIAKLQHKVGKFGLIKDEQHAQGKQPATDTEEEALAVLVQLGYKRPEALQMIKKATAFAAGSIRSTEELLNEVYKQKRIKV